MGSVWTLSPIYLHREPKLLRALSSTYITSHPFCLLVTSTLLLKGHCGLVRSFSDSD